MRKESATVQKCKRQMATLGFDSQLAYHRVKLILKIYRDVVWVLSERVEELHEYAWELGAQDADSKSKRLEDRLMPEKQEETIRELTLMLMYLTSWEERDTPEMRAVKKKELEKYPLVRRCWKGYDHDLLDKLSEEGLINAAGRTYPALITPEGEAEARKLLAQYGIDTEGRRRRSAER